MSLTDQVLAASRQANTENPERLNTNRNVDCFRHTTRVIQILKAQGLDAAYIGKTRGEGQYSPPSGFPRQVGSYTITGVSHDAIWINQFVQYDTIASGNDGPEPLGSPGIPIANEIPAQYYRPNNPPVAYPIAPVVEEPPPPAKPTYPSYEALGGDEGGKKITRQLEADYKRAGLHGLDGDCGAWQQRVSYDFLTGVCKTVEESIKKHRDEWCQTLGISAD